MLLHGCLALTELVQWKGSRVTTKGFATAGWRTAFTQQIADQAQSQLPASQDLLTLCKLIAIGSSPVPEGHCK